jgi:predicted ATPase
LAKTDKQVAKYIQLSTILETKILHGNVNFKENEIENNKRLFFSQSKDVNLDISIASSMVKELAPLDLCLRYLIQAGDYLIIDEPEMNLHPEAQVKFIEFLVMLVNNGLNLIITTHSSYMVDHLSNLIRAYESSDQEKISALFYLKNKDAFIDKNKVSINLFENGTARSILTESGEIDWGTFSNVSENISKISFSI